MAEEGSNPSPITRRELIVVGLITAAATIIIGLCLFYFARDFFPSRNIEITISPLALGKPDLSDLSKELESIIRDAVNDSFAAFGSLMSVVGVGLALFTIVFGLFYLRRGQELSDALAQAKNAPDEFVNMFYQKQLDDLQVALLDRNHLARSVAIRQLMMNPRITSKYFQIINNTLIAEYASEDNQFASINIANLIQIAMVLDEKRTTATLAKLLADEPLSPRTYTLAVYFTRQNISEVRDKIKPMLLGDNVQKYYAVAGSFLQTGVLQEFLFDILSEGSVEAALFVITNHGVEQWKIDIEPYLLTALSMRTNYDEQVFLVTIQSQNLSVDIRIQALKIACIKSNTIPNNLLVNFLGLLNRDGRVEDIKLIRKLFDQPPLSDLANINRKDNVILADFLGDTRYLD